MDLLLSKTNVYVADFRKARTLLKQQVETSILPSASDFQILEGHFSSIGHDSSSFTARDVHVTINHHHTPRPPLASSSSSRPNPTNAPNVYQGRFSSSENEAFRSNVTAQTNYDIYRTHLATKGRGLPLWIPEPSQRLPIQYQRQGISLGDVGVVTNAGNFIFLFNIFLPMNHPINSSTMPEGFKPLQMMLDDGSVSEQRELKDNSYLASPSCLRTEKKEGCDHLIFKSSRLGGAILTVPVGAQKEDLTCISRLRKYVNANLTSWYRYACLHRGMEMQSGDLKVVIGCEKTSAWGMACLGLSDIPAPVSVPSTDSKDHRFYLEFGPTASDYRRGGRYAWTYSGEVAEVRAGPDASEVAHLRTTVRGHEAVERQEHDLEYFENQCLFLRTMNPVLPEKVWEGLMLEQDSEDDEEDGTTEKEETDHNPRHEPAAERPGSGNQGTGRWDPGQESSRSSRTRDQQAPRKHSILNAVSDTAPIIHSMMSLADHPSISINRFLLKNCSEKATMAVTLDQDWISVLREDDVILPSSEDLLERILKYSSICEEEGVVFFNSEYQRETSNTASVVADQDENESYCTGRTTEENAHLNLEDVGEPEEILENPSLFSEGSLRPCKNYRLHTASPSPSPYDNQSRNRSRPDDRRTRSDFYLEPNTFEESLKARSNIRNSSLPEDTIDNVRDRPGSRSHSISFNHQIASAKRKPDESPPPTNSKRPPGTSSGRDKASQRYASDDLDEDEEEAKEDDQPDPDDQDHDLANSARRTSKKPELETKEIEKKNFLKRNRQAALNVRQRKKAWLAQLQAQVETLTQENERLTTALTSSREEISRLSALVGGVGVIDSIPAGSRASSLPVNTNISLSGKLDAAAAVLGPGEPGEGPMDIDPIPNHLVF